MLSLSIGGGETYAGVDLLKIRASCTTYLLQHSQVKMGSFVGIVEFEVGSQQFEAYA